MISMSDIDALVARSDKPLRIPWLDELYKVVENNVSTRINYYRFLYHLVHARHPAACLELGVEFGLASAHMALAGFLNSTLEELAQGCATIVIGVDIHYHNIPGELVVSQCPNYTFLIGDTISMFNTVKALLGDRKIGVVFQDSSHHYKESCEEWRLYAQLLDQNAIWVCDDITPAFRTPDEPKGMVEYFQERPGTKKLYPEVLNHGNTIGVIVI